MKKRDFLFSFSQTINFEIEKKAYSKVLRKCFYFPYKFLLNKIRIFLSIKKIDIDKIDINKKENLDKLFIRFNSDKASQLELGGKVIKGHNYSPFYEKYFQKFKNKKNLKILEIGTLRGAAAASFYHYFCEPKVYCLDLNPFQTYFYSKNIRTIYCNTRSKNTINSVAKYLDHKFDIIIDDGSHNVKDQILTLNTFLPKLITGGIYVIEDISQYLVFPHLNSDGLKNVTKLFLESINSDNVKIPECLTNDEYKNIKDNIKNLFFERGEYFYQNTNISDIVFIEK
jgi:hypothetical protein